MDISQIISITETPPDTPESRDMPEIAQEMVTDGRDVFRSFRPIMPANSSAQQPPTVAPTQHCHIPQLVANKPAQPVQLTTQVCSPTVVSSSAIPALPSNQIIVLNATNPNPIVQVIIVNDSKMIPSALSKFGDCSASLQGHKAIRPKPGPTDGVSPVVTLAKADGCDADRAKIHRCTYDNCDKTYYKSSHLKAHLRLHTGTNLFFSIFPNHIFMVDWISCNTRYFC